MTNKDAVKLIQEIEEDGRNVTKEHIEALDMAIKALDIYKTFCPVEFPTEDDPYPVCSYTRPQGEWITQEKGAFYPIECSNCHNEPACKDEGYVLSKFCPECGAKMKGGRE